MDKGLFAEFPPVTDEQWQQQVLKDLKGSAPETLEWETPEGITVKPYYRAGNQPNLQVPVRPVGEWLIRQDLTVTDEATANTEALDALQRGATALLFKCEGTVEVSALLADVLIEHIHTDWATTDTTVLDGLASLIKERGLKPTEVKGSVSLHEGEVVGYFEKYKQLLPGFQLLGIAASNQPTLTEQTAHQLAQANQIVQALTQAGIPAAEVLPHIRFEVEVGTDHFFEIARIRVLRALWMVICRQYVADYALPATIHATNKKTAPEKDSYYEMIRQTTQALSAVIGGVDSLSLVPHVAAPDRSMAFQTRIARNVQLILQHESHLDAIADPAAGSWYLEDITSQMAEKAWAGFLSLTQLT